MGESISTLRSVLFGRFREGHFFYLRELREFLVESEFRSSRSFLLRIWFKQGPRSSEFRDRVCRFTCLARGRQRFCLEIPQPILQTFHVRTFPV
jgi:hypothetical protein